MRRSSLFPFATLLVLAACSSSSSGDTTPATSDDVDPQAESADSATYGDSTTKLTSAKAITELFVQEDPTIDTAKTAGQNADAVAAQIAASTSTCATITIAHVPGDASVTADFGTGCTIGSLGTVSGKVVAEVTRATGVTVTFTFTNLVAAGYALTGSAAETTTDGTTYSSNVDLTVNGKHLTFKGTAKLDADAKGVTFDGGGTAQTAATSAYSVGAVHHVFGGCYADAGKLTLQKQTTTKTGRATTVSETVAFDASTPSTGRVTITVSGASQSTTLPAYGSCPHG